MTLCLHLSHGWHASAAGRPLTSVSRTSTVQSLSWNAIELNALCENKEEQDVRVRASSLRPYVEAMRIVQSRGFQALHLRGRSDDLECQITELT
jgi:hypothetical protein